ncbi:amidase [Nitratireductor sp. ZSWI3]|uniref:amidase n=1 Tax=Nitratireductor sp. ZSWI3 TaxID=2966359 RepID=UPI00214FDDA2|nr:amidase [Nitratireductor sp. ZSWI3]MCR4265810.1 amidase [Nitratireductor sp. ZSWI3]
MAASVASGALSPVELTESVIAAVEERNPSINAMVVFGFEDARRRAEQAEAAVKRGDALGLLHGVPIAMKDLFNFKPGWPTTFGGLKAFKDHIADSTSNFVARTEAAGAIMVGKGNSPALGFRGTTDNYLFGATKNPFNLAKNAGGSSGGSAALVADGLVPLAEGTDGGGSIRIPASWCGVVGYKASFGRVPNVARPNAFATTSPYIYEGPITRTVEDAAIAIQVTSGYDPRDPNSLDEKVDFIGSLKRGIKGMKIAYSPDYGIFPIEQAVREVIDRSVRTFEALGAHVELIDPGIPVSQKELSDIWCRMSAHNVLQAMDGFRAMGVDLAGKDRDNLPPELHFWIEEARKQSAQDWLNDHHATSQVYDAIQSTMAKYDLLVTPTLACLPVDNTGDGNTMGPRQIDGIEVDPLIGWCCTYIQNYTGHPAVSVPAGLAHDNLPVGLQIAGRRFADCDVLAAAAAFEAAQPWAHTYDICASRHLAA